MNQKNILSHVAIIMDGNGRWAKERQIERSFGHSHGLNNIERIARHAIKLNIKYLTLFAFSTENFQRPREEVDFLLALFEKAIEKYEKFLLENKIIFKMIGGREILNNKLKEKIFNLEHITQLHSNESSLIMIIAFNYGGRADIVNATKEIAKKITDKEIEIGDIDQNYFEKHLYTHNLPEPDLLIRTGGQKRISNFLLWQLVYTEIMFSDTHWPDFDESEFDLIINEFYLRKRSFGKI